MIASQGTSSRFLMTSTVLSCALGLTAAAGKPEPASKPPTYMTEVEAGMGNIQPDGTLKLRYSLCPSDELRLIGVQCELVHFIETDIYGRPRSVWRIAGLKTSLTPYERTKLIWRSLTGAPIEFDRKSIGRALTEAGPAGWRIRQSGSNEYEIRSLDGRGWRYVSGLLASAQHPALGELKFETTGAWIRTLQRADAASGSPPLLEVTYDALARPIGLRIGTSSPHTFQWDEKGFLVSWQRPEGDTVSFSYREGLLEKIIEAQKPARQFTWATNPGHERGDSRWAAPVYLASDGESTYAYQLSSKGFVIRRHEIASDRETLTVFNPRRHRLEQRSHDKAFIVTFKAQGKGESMRVTGLERIENGKGEVLEDYRYDNRGQLVGIKRKGEPERSLSYDETGRLMTLTEGKPP